MSAEVLEQEKVSRAQVLAMLGVALSLFLVSLDQTVVGTAMPRIIAELNGFELYAWVTTIYLLAETAVLPIVGKLGDTFGRKWFVIGGLALFIAASALCGQAQSMYQLIAFRGIQGIGAGMALATSFTLVADIFPDMRQRARYQGLLFSVFALSSVIGPVLGGWITDAVGWRWLFYVNVPLGILAFLVLPSVLPKGVRRGGAHIDYLGAVTIVIAIVTLLFGLELIGLGYVWTSPLVWGSLLVSALAFALFIPIERRAAEPILPLDLFKNRVIVSASLILFFQGVTMFGATLFLPLFLQGVLGLSPSQSGLAMMPLVIAMTTVGIVMGRLVARYQVIRPFQRFGILSLVLGVGLLMTLNAGSPVWLVSVYLLLMGLGLGSLMPVNTMAVQSSVETRNLGVATSSTQFIRSIGATVGTAAVGTLVTSRYLSAVSATMPAGLPDGAAEVLHSPNALINETTQTTLANLLASLPEAAQTMTAMLEVARLSLATALHSAFIVLFVASLLMLASSLLMPKIDLREAMARRSRSMKAESAPEIAPEITAEEVSPLALAGEGAPGH